MKRVLVPLAPGFEEVEALTVVDILRRAGAEVTLAGTVDGPITGRNKIKILADTGLENAFEADYDLIVLPGGAVGTSNLKKDARVEQAVRRLNQKGGFVTAICAAPTVLSAFGVSKGRTITSHPGVRSEFKTEKISDDRVVADGNIITSQGPGTAMEFAFRLVEALFGAKKAAEVNEDVLARL